MNTEFAAILKDLIAQHGDSILSDPRRVTAFLADIAINVPKPQRSAFIRCLEMDSAKALKNAAETDRPNTKQRLAQKLHEEEGLVLDLCVETLDLLAAVLFGEEIKKNVSSAKTSKEKANSAKPPKEKANLKKSAKPTRETIREKGGVTEIGLRAFMKQNLTSYTIPDGVTHIGREAFWGNKLTSIAIPNSVTHIGDYAFTNNQLSSITIPDSVTHIGEQAFANNQLLSVIIPDSVTHIGKQAFCNNPGLTSINVSANNATYKSIEGVLYNKDGNILIECPARELFTIPYGVTHIGECAFASNRLTSVNIPDSVIYIRDGAFASNRLTSVTIPNSVTYIGDNAFASNRLTSVIIPSSVTHIGDFAFSNNQLTRVTIPNGVTHIGNYAFDIFNIVTAMGEFMNEQNGQPRDLRGGFLKFYQKEGCEAGTYVFDDDEWSME
jgi:hypothetical protein